MGGDLSCAICGTDITEEDFWSNPDMSECPHCGYPIGPQ